MFYFWRGGLVVLHFLLGFASSGGYATGRASGRITSEGAPYPPMKLTLVLSIAIGCLVPFALPAADSSATNDIRRPAEVLSKEGPNAIEWALAPLKLAVPTELRQNLTLLREDLLDEAAKKPVAGAEAYKLAERLCNALIETLDERENARVRAGYTAVQAQANIAVTNQALEARRRFTSWPTYEREKDQREELRKEKQNGAALVNERPILEWADRGAQIRKVLDALYAQYREAARRPAVKS